MYVARFSYNIRPVDRDRAIALLRQEVAAATGQGLDARLLIPLTRPPGGAALQYVVFLDDLDTFETFRDSGMGGEEATRAWLRELSEILLEPPTVELLRIDEARDASGGDKGGERRGLIGARPSPA
jgi:hypothetical protein